ncbi:MAG: right-handed parallel beta-helix repeat-containing protein [Candidatus Peribacteraceae bacterium]|nr:right-handed parallel beta-helix repeat-containing protein [Candidatus Peribacteraceae bacterium]
MADTNGTDGIGADGDGFSFHDTTTGTIRRSVAKNNLKTAVANVGDAQVTIERSKFTHTTNGTLALVYLEGTSYELYNNVIYSPAHIGTGLHLVSGTFVLKNNIIDGFDVGILKNSGTVTEDFNLVYGTATSGWSGLSQGSHSITSDPLFHDASSLNVAILSGSPAIDGGIDVGLTSDYAENPIYGLPDIGAYEYQPPRTMGTDDPDATAEARVYGDGAFRYTNSTGGLTANLSVRPIAATTADFLDLNISTWDTNVKSWTESSSTLGVKSVAHTVGDLQPGRNYQVKIDGAPVNNICGSSACIANAYGQITFTYTGGYSTHSFDVTGQGAAAANRAREEWWQQYELELQRQAAARAGGAAQSSSVSSVASSSSSSSSDPYRLLHTPQASSPSLTAVESASSSSAASAHPPSRIERICARVNRWIPPKSPRRASVLRRLEKWLGITCGD